MELHLTNWNYLETAMYIDTTLVAKIILDFHQSNGTGVNKEPVIMPLKTGMPWTVTRRNLALYVSLGIIF